ncbi:MAG: competence/damage-inducible protein A [Phycisphaerae bacterium]
MKAAIVSTGDELIIGKTLDTNSHWLINQLTDLDVETICCLTVGDDKSRIIWALRQAIEQASLVILTGGLGPTDDDLTRFALAELAGVELFEHKESLRKIEDFFKSRNRPMNERNRIQAMMPEGTEVLANPGGTAPGIKMAIGQTTVFAIPGVPREMKQMHEFYIQPWLKNQVRQKISRRRLHCVGIGESDLVHRIDDLVVAQPEVTFGTTANEGIISIGLACKNQNAMDSLEQSIRQRLGWAIFGSDNDSLPGVVGQLLKERNEKLITAESCTGGLIGKMITDVSGSSDYYLGGFITYSNEVKHRELSVPAELLKVYGAVSSPVAEAMAKGALEKTQVDWSISVTGIAGPAGGSETKPVGLVYIGLANRRGFCEVKEFRYGNPGREAVRIRSALSALDMLRLTLLAKA